MVSLSRTLTLLVQMTLSLTATVQKSSSAGVKSGIQKSPEWSMRVTLQSASGKAYQQKTSSFTPYQTVNNARKST